MILVSACLLGENCKYSGGNNRCQAVLDYIRERDEEYIPICPEIMGGLPIPRQPSELRGEQVFAKDGSDVTAEFYAGARRCLDFARESGAEAAILKEGSPSCGVHLIYDGSFSDKKIPGMGITARFLAAEGMELKSEEDIEAEMSGK